MNIKTFVVCVLGLAVASCATAPPKKESFDPLKRWKEIQKSAGLVVEPVKPPKAKRVVIKNATVMTAAGQILKNGYVIFSDRIEAVGEGEPKVAADVHVIDGSGLYVTPGLIDTHSHLGVYPSPWAKAHSDGNEMTTPTTPGAWAEHSFWPQDPGIELAVAGGITSLQALPGSGNLIGGRGVVLHMTPQRGTRAMRFPGAPETIKMACGENPKRVYGKRKRTPSTRMGNVWLQRQAFAKAKAYLHKLKTKKHVARDIQMETLVGVLLGEILPQVHCYKADDMLSFLQLAEEFGFSIRSFHHALEAYKIRDVLAEKDVSVSTWADWWGFKMEAYDAVLENAAMVSAAGGKAIIHSDSATGIQRLNQEASKAMHTGRRAGLKITENEALRWITYNAAWALGIHKEVGTLEKGKRADIVVWDKHPFSVYSSAKWVFVDGLLRFNIDKKSLPWSDFMLGQEVTP